MSLPELSAANLDCLMKCEVGEPMFIILGRDPDGANIVRLWGQRRSDAGDPEHGAQALLIADQMDAWAKDHKPNSAPPPEAYRTNQLVERDGVAGAWADVLAERQRQISAEGYTPEHDDHHASDYYLPRAAACYALAGAGGGSGPFWITHLQTPQQVWPYRWEWKPGDNRRNLVKAAALLLAEIERIDRAALTAIKGDTP